MMNHMNNKKTRTARGTVSDRIDLLERTASGDGETFTPVLVNALEDRSPAVRG
jgi:hypothetical protein